MRYASCALVCLALALAGCQTIGSSAKTTSTETKALTPATPGAGATPLAAVMSSPTGGVLHDTSGRSWQVQVIESYYAASGRECRRIGMTLVGSTSAPLDRVACQTGSGWQLVAPLQPAVDEPKFASISS